MSQIKAPRVDKLISKVYRLHRLRVFVVCTGGQKLVSWPELLLNSVWTVKCPHRLLVW